MVTVIQPFVCVYEGDAGLCIGDELNECKKFYRAMQYKDYNLAMQAFAYIAALRSYDWR